MIRPRREGWPPSSLRGWSTLVGRYALLLPILVVVFLGGFTLFGGWLVVDRGPVWLRWLAYGSAALIAVLMVGGYLDDLRRRRSLPEER